MLAASFVQLTNKKELQGGNLPVLQLPINHNLLNIVACRRFCVSCRGCRLLRRVKVNLRCVSSEIYHNVLVERPVDKSKLKPEVAARTADTCLRHEVKEFVVKCIDQPDGILETKLSSPVAGLDKIVNAPDVVFRGADARYMRDETDGKK